MRPTRALQLFFCSVFVLMCFCWLAATATPLPPCRQTRKLQEMVKALQQENEDLKRRFACGGGGRSNGSGGGMHTAGGVQLSTSGRHPLPFGSGPMQMVSTTGRVVTSCHGTSVACG